MMTTTSPIPYDDFGGSGPPLHFSHANAYTPGCYRQFLEPLTRDYHVLAAHHRPLWYLAPGHADHEQAAPGEGTADWPTAAADLLRFLDQQGLERVIGVGHSLGAVSTMLAARQQPERFSAIVLIDPVFLSPHVLETAAANPDHLFLRGMVQGALRRRDRWASRQEAFDRFRAKPVFERFSDEALWDYLNHGLHEEPETGEVVLSYPRDWEARFYTDPPQMVWDELPQLTVPTLAIRASESDTLFPDAWAQWQLLQPAATFVEMDGVGHMVPIEAPVDTAVVVEHWLGDRGAMAQGRS